MSPARQHQPHHAPIMAVHKADSAPAPFPFFQVLRYFKSFCRETPEVKAVHRSLFYYVLELVEQRGVSRLKLDRDSAMEGAGIGSKDTYTAALKQLHAWGIIAYTPGANGNRAAIVEVLPKSSVPETGHNLGRYWDATQDTDQDATGTTKELVDFKTLTSEREARALAEKKIAELQAENARLQAQAAASHTGGGAAAAAEPFLDAASPSSSPLRVVPPAAEDDLWFARPRDIEMVDEFLAHHHQQRVRQHAGKGYLFWAEYAGKALTDGTWIFSNGRPMTNWRASILSFGFREPVNSNPTSASSYATANSASKPRPVNGAKPTGSAGALARALYEHQQQPGAAGDGPG